MPTTHWIWGRRPVLEALAAGRVRRILISGTARGGGLASDVEAAARAGGINVERVPAAEINRRAPEQSTQGVLAEIEATSVVDLDDIVEAAREGTRPPFLLALDQVQDPRNLGSLLRSADAAGVDGIIVPKAHSADLSGVVAKTSAGALYHVRIASVPNLRSALRRLKDRGIWIAGLDMAARQSIYDMDLTIPLTLVVGGEGKGMRRLTREDLDLTMHIPMRGTVASLNVSVAGAIAMFEVVRQRESQ